MKTEKNDKTSKMPPVPFKKDEQENPERGSGKQDREQSRMEDFDRDKDELAPEQNPESVDFEQKTQNEREGDTERDPQKRKPLSEDPDHVAKQGKEFEPGIDDDNSNAV